MRPCILRLLVCVPLLLFVAGCASLREARERSFNTNRDPSLTILGQVGASGSGMRPPHSELQLRLKHQAARQFGVAVDEIVLGPIEVDEHRSMTTEPEYVTVGVATVAMPTGHGVSYSWSATAEVSRKVAKKS